jgi:hypothetical protein
LTSDRDDAGVTPAETALFTTIHYGITISPSDLPSAAVREWYGGDPVTEKECRDALAACLAKNWLQIIDEMEIARITDELCTGGFSGPIYGGLPSIGCVDFTHAGAELWHRLRGPRETTKIPFAFTDVVHSKTTHYFRTKAAALIGIEDVRECADDVTVVGPIPIGPWRAQWWRRFPEGYRIEIEERRQWQGRCGGGVNCFMPHPSPGPAPQRLRQILDCHNVAFAEWVMLAAMDRGWTRSRAHLPKWVAESANRHFGITVSDDECQAGLEACFRNGWLTIMDANATDKVKAVLRDEPAMMPVAGEWSEIDFTSGGATLYRNIAAEWLGTDWEDELRVEKETYREEHRYCENEDGLRGIVPEYAHRGEVVRPSKVVPIGPWCVYWWERFPVGYRLELQIGEP